MSEIGFVVDSGVLDSWLLSLNKPADWEILVPSSPCLVFVRVMRWVNAEQQQKVPLTPF